MTDLEDRILAAIRRIVVDRGSDYGRNAELEDLTLGDVMSGRLLRRIVKAAAKTSAQSEAAAGIRRRRSPAPRHWRRRRKACAGASWGLTRRTGT
jgi:hypothetical protein